MKIARYHYRDVRAARYVGRACRGRRPPYHATKPAWSLDCAENRQPAARALLPRILRHLLRQRRGNLFCIAEQDFPPALRAGSPSRATGYITRQARGACGGRTRHHQDDLQLP